MKFDYTFVINNNIDKYIAEFEEYIVNLNKDTHLHYAINNIQKIPLAYIIKLILLKTKYIKTITTYIKSITLQTMVSSMVISKYVSLIQRLFPQTKQIIIILEP